MFLDNVYYPFKKNSSFYKTFLTVSDERKYIILDIDPIS